MKTFLKVDYYLQIFFLIAGIISAIIGCFLDFGFILFYFIVGIPQLISFSIRAFQISKKTWMYNVYAVFIIPVWISWIFIIGLNNNTSITDVFGFILIASVFYSPVLAVLYVVDTYKLYKSQNNLP